MSGPINMQSPEKATSCQAFWNETCGQLKIFGTYLGRKLCELMNWTGACLNSAKDGAYSLGSRLFAQLSTAWKEQPGFVAGIAAAITLFLAGLGYYMFGGSSENTPNKTEKA